MERHGGDPVDVGRRRRDGGHGRVVPQARRFVNTVPGLALRMRASAPRWRSRRRRSSARADGRRTVRAGSRVGGGDEYPRLPRPVIPFASVASVARQVSAPAFVIAFLTKSAASRACGTTGSRHRRSVRSVRAWTLTVTARAALRAVARRAAGDRPVTAWFAGRRRARRRAAPEAAARRQARATGCCPRSPSATSSARPTPRVPPRPASRAPTGNVVQRPVDLERPRRHPGLRAARQRVVDPDPARVVVLAGHEELLAGPDRGQRGTRVGAGVDRQRRRRGRGIAGSAAAQDPAADGARDQPARRRRSRRPAGRRGCRRPCRSRLRMRSPGPPTRDTGRPSRPAGPYGSAGHLVSPPERPGPTAR